MPSRKVTVRVPATTANLGPAFDCIGMALNLYATVTLERSDRFAIAITGNGTESLSHGEDNLVYRSVCALYRKIGREPPALRLACHNAIPLNRGLGSSAAAVVGGLVAARAFERSDLPDVALLRLATALEGHPDNVAPALLGGCQVVAANGDDLVASRVPVKRGLRAVVFIPDVELSTRKARGVLPADLPRADAVYNLGRASLLVLALSQGRWELLRVATQDRLHQPQRQALFPAMQPVFDAALDAGAKGVFLSGAGSAVLALVTGGAAPVGRAMAAAARRSGVSGAWEERAIAARGATAVEAA